MVPHYALLERSLTLLFIFTAGPPKRMCTSMILWQVLSSPGPQHRGLSILPGCYPQPISDAPTMQITNASNGWNLSSHTIDQIMSVPNTPATSNPCIPTTEEIMAEFSSVFVGQICTMPGKKFHIALTADTWPFCVTTPRIVPFAYRDKLQNEIDLLVSQG